MEIGVLAPQLLPDVYALFKMHERLYRKSRDIKEDISTLESISDKKQGIRYLDFDGETYSARQALTVRDTLLKDAELADREQHQLDHLVAAHFKAIAIKLGKEDVWQRHYVYLYLAIDWTDKINTAANELIKLLQQAFQQQHEVSEAATLSTRVSQQAKGVHTLLDECWHALQYDLPDEIVSKQQCIKDFQQSSSQPIFQEQSFQQEAIDALWTSTAAVVNMNFDLFFLYSKTDGFKFSGVAATSGCGYFRYR